MTKMIKRTLVILSVSFSFQALSLDIEPTIYVIGSKVEGTRKQIDAKRAARAGKIVYDCKKQRLNLKGTLTNSGKSLYVIGSVPKGATDDTGLAEDALYESKSATVYKCQAKMWDKKLVNM